jgi:hypothetical protein
MSGRSIWIDAMLSIPDAPLGATIDPAEFVFASLARALEFAPAGNKRAVFRLLARDARQRLDEQFQTAVDELWDLAEASGLLDLVGATALQEDFLAAFGGER